jgi:hypothetical protein
MRFGLVTDIHEAVEPLRQALKHFRRVGVDRVVSLGDACDTFGPGGGAGDVVALLHEAGAVGVWGNHDFGLCRDVSEKLRQGTEPAVLEYMAGMQPQLAMEGCRFSHVEPWLDAEQVENLWYFEGPPDTPAKAARSFAAVPERYLFMGHLHHWLIMTPAGRVDWDGETPVELNREPRYLVIVAPVVSGWCAIFDTADSRLTPVRCAASLHE